MLICCMPNLPSNLYYGYIGNSPLLVKDLICGALVLLCFLSGFYQRFSFFWFIWSSISTLFFLQGLGLDKWSLKFISTRFLHGISCRSLGGSRCRSNSNRRKHWGDIGHVPYAHSLDMLHYHKVCELYVDCNLILYVPTLIVEWVLRFFIYSDIEKSLKSIAGLTNSMHHLKRLFYLLFPIYLIFI